MSEVTNPMSGWKGLTNPFKAEHKIENPCKTPGQKIKSEGKGRGLSKGGGKGPVGVPYKGK